MNLTYFFDLIFCKSILFDYKSVPMNISNYKGAEFLYH